MPFFNLFDPANLYFNTADLFIGGVANLFIGGVANPVYFAATCPT
jgi:hypothetical protein